MRVARETKKQKIENAKQHPSGGSSRSDAGSSQTHAIGIRLQIVAGGNDHEGPLRLSARSMPVLAGLKIEARCSQGHSIVSYGYRHTLPNGMKHEFWRDTSSWSAFGISALDPGAHVLSGNAKCSGGLTSEWSSTFLQVEVGP
jgi:hypothetical protein